MRTGLNEGAKADFHALVIDAAEESRANFGLVEKINLWNVGKYGPRPCGRVIAHFGMNIPETHVHRPRLFSSCEVGQMGRVRAYNHGYDGRTLRKGGLTTLSNEV